MNLMFIYLVTYIYICIYGEITPMTVMPLVTNSFHKFL